MLAAAIALPAVAADQTKLYDPMAEAEKIVVPVELLSKDGAKPIGNVVIVKNAYGLAFYPQLKDLAPVKKEPAKDKKSQTPARKRKAISKGEK
jgi:Cu-Zn family superoxide dismutase